MGGEKKKKKDQKKRRKKSIMTGKERGETKEKRGKEGYSYELGLSPLSPSYIYASRV